MSVNFNPQPMKNISLSISYLLISCLTVFGTTSFKNEAGFLSSNPFGEFTSIELRNSANVIITQGKVNDVRIEKISGIEVLIFTEKNKLIISDASDIAFAGKGTTVYVTVKNLRQVISSGNGNVSLTGPITSDNMEVRINNSGSVNASLDTKNLKVTISGAGDFEVNGKTDASDIKIDGSGSIHGKDLKTSTSNIVITGSGCSTVDVVDDLTVNITGSGNVYFIEYPERMNARSKSIGQVEKIKA